ncbi:MAG TPA: alpha/beta fold hydrolase [Gemmatimonadales bacterium]|nr:alpha/beta fold hydrolase [Gemmatimonadales bacterium]
MSRLPPVSVTIYPYECDAFGHLNEAGFLQVFERARWDAIARGPGMDLFSRNGVWPAVRKATVEYTQQVFPGEQLEVTLKLERLGNTSMELRQEARRGGDGQVVATADLVFVMIDRDGRATRVPDEVAEMFGRRVSTLPGEVVRYQVGDITLAADVRGDGPVLILVHGFPLDRTIWRHQVATLSGWRRVAPDLRGFGFSEAPASGYSLSAYADDLVGLLDRLKVPRAVFAGLSMGGYVLFELLRRHRDRVAGLVLCDTKAEADTPDGKKGRDEMIALARERGTDAIADRMVARVLGRTTQRTQPQLVAQVREMIIRTPVAGVVGALEAMRDRPDSRELLSTITVPTLVIVGEEDELTPPAAARAMTEAIPSAAMTTIPGAGHIAPLEAPTAVSRVLAEFLEGMERS